MTVDDKNNSIFVNGGGGGDDMLPEKGHNYSYCIRTLVSIMIKDLRRSQLFGGLCMIHQQDPG